MLSLKAVIWYGMANQLCIPTLAHQQKDKGWRKGVLVEVEKKDLSLKVFFPPQKPSLPASFPLLNAHCML